MRRHRDGMTSSATTSRAGHREEPILKHASIGPGLLDRGELLQLLDRALTRRLTVISAPPGSGKTSLLRAWADRWTEVRPIAFVSVEREEQSAERFWGAVLDAIHSRASSIDS